MPPPGFRRAYLTASQLRSRIRHRSCRRDPVAGAILALDPVKLTGGLLLAALRRGARLHAPEEAVKIIITGVMA